MDETPSTDAGDDYSYDLAHDVPATGEQRPRTTPHRPDPPGTASRPDEVGDYSYDLAHEVPPARRKDR